MFCKKLGGFGLTDTRISSESASEEDWRRGQNCQAGTIHCFLFVNKQKKE